MKFCVIGVGRFGYYVATTLANHGMEVVAVDSNETIISDIKDKVTHAICMRVSDEEALRAIGVDEMDTVIVAMGENFAQSILVTALLKQKLKVGRVIARSISSIHKEILQLIGADQVILPEREMGIRLADNLSLPFNSLLRISADFSICEIEAHPSFIGQTLEKLDLPRTYYVTCIGIKRADSIVTPMPDTKIRQSDVLIFSGSVRDLEKLNRLS